MKRPLRGVQALAFAAALTLTMAACTGDSSGEGADTPTETAPQTPAAATGNGELVIGALLPQTGNLAALGPAQLAGVKAAVADINAAGGVNGKPVVQHDADSADATTGLPTQSTDQLLAQGSDVIIGGAASDVSLAVIDKITRAGVAQISPSNTAPDFSRYQDNGLYFRTAPSDVLQGRVLGEQIAQDGRTKVGMLVRDDAYGKGLSEAVQKALEDKGAELSRVVSYDPKATADLSADITLLKSSTPDALVLIGYDETKTVIPEVAAQGLAVPIYLVDANLVDYGEDVPAGALNGAKGTRPGVALPDPLRAKLLEADGDLTLFSYGAEAYDATIIAALAATAGKDDSGASVASQLQAVTTGGEKCTDYAACVALLAQNKDIDYDGASGPLELDEWGDPTQATIGVYQYGEDNTFTNVTYVAGQL